MQNLLKYHHMIDPMYAQVEDDKLEIVWHDAAYELPEGTAVVGARNALILVIPFWLAVGVAFALFIL